MPFKIYPAVVYLLIALFPLIPGNHCSFGQQGAAQSLGAKSKPQISDPGPLKNIYNEIAERTIPTVVSVIPTTVDTVEYFRNPFFSRTPPHLTLLTISLEETPGLKGVNIVSRGLVPV